MAETEIIDIIPESQPEAKNQAITPAETPVLNTNPNTKLNKGFKLPEDIRNKAIELFKQGNKAFKVSKILGIAYLTARKYETKYKTNLLNAIPLTNVKTSMDKTESQIKDITAQTLRVARESFTSITQDKLDKMSGVQLATTGAISIDKY